jgi:hypothetical protein
MIRAHMNFLPKKEMMEAISAKNRASLIIGARYYDNDGTIVCLTGDTKFFTIPAAYVKKAKIPEADLDNVQPTDHGQTLKFGKVEWASNAVIKDCYPGVRKKKQKLKLRDFTRLHTDRLIAIASKRDESEEARERASVAIMVLLARESKLSKRDRMWDRDKPPLVDPSERHKHKWTIFSSQYTGPKMIMTERCSLCRKERTRPAKKAEWTESRKVWDTKIHKVYHAFSKKIGEEFGYDAMQIAERFAEKHPNAVKVIGVDDDHFSSSSLVLIAHEDPEDYFMGTSAVFIPQCAGGPPTKFFLYPGHVEELIEGLQHFKKMYETHQGKKSIERRRMHARFDRERRLKAAAKLYR